MGMYSYTSILDARLFIPASSILSYDLSKDWLAKRYFTMSKKMGIVAFRRSVSGMRVISRKCPTISGTNEILCWPRLNHIWCTSRPISLRMSLYWKRIPALKSFFFLRWASKICLLWHYRVKNLFLSMWLVLGVAKMKAAFKEVPQNTTWLFSAPPHSLFSNSTLFNYPFPGFFVNFCLFHLFGRK